MLTCVQSRQNQLDKRNRKYIRWFGLKLKSFLIFNFSQSLKRNKNAFLRLVCKGSNIVNQFAFEADNFRGLSEIH